MGEQQVTWRSRFDSGHRHSAYSTRRVPSSQVGQWGYEAIPCWQKYGSNPSLGHCQRWQNKQNLHWFNMLWLFNWSQDYGGSWANWPSLAVRFRTCDLGWQLDLTRRCGKPTLYSNSPASGASYLVLILSGGESLPVTIYCSGYLVVAHYINDIQGFDVWFYYAFNLVPISYDFPPSGWRTYKLGALGCKSLLRDCGLRVLTTMCTATWWPVWSP